MINFFNKHRTSTATTVTTTETDDLSSLSGDSGTICKRVRKQNMPDKAIQAKLVDSVSNCRTIANHERAVCGRAILQPSRFLDTLAQQHADHMAKTLELSYIVCCAQELRVRLQSWHAGANFHCGVSPHEMHARMLLDHACRQTMLSENFCEFGMGVSAGLDGQIYMVQLFRGEPFKRDAK
jgi:uncharacterized protein YkwD